MIISTRLRATVPAAGNSAGAKQRIPPAMARRRSTVTEGEGLVPGDSGDDGESVSEVNGLRRRSGCSGVGVQQGCKGIGRRRAPPRFGAAM